MRDPPRTCYNTNFKISDVPCGAGSGGTTTALADGPSQGVEGSGARFGGFSLFERLSVPRREIHSDPGARGQPMAEAIEGMPHTSLSEEQRLSHRGFTTHLSGIFLHDALETAHQDGGGEIALPEAEPATAMEVNAVQQTLSFPTQQLLASRLEFMWSDVVKVRLD